MINTVIWSKQEQILLSEKHGLLNNSFAITSDDPRTSSMIISFDRLSGLSKKSRLCTTGSGKDPLRPSPQQLSISLFLINLRLKYMTVCEGSS